MRYQRELFGMAVGLGLTIGLPAAGQETRLEEALRDAVQTLGEMREEHDTAILKRLPAGESAHDTRALEEALNDYLRAGLSTIEEVYAKAIYGVDDRKNYDHPQVTDAQRRAADATAALVAANRLTPVQGRNFFDLPSGNVIDPASGRGLCTPTEASERGQPEEPFWDEANPAFCSGFKVGKDLMATAGHCIRSASDCNRTRFVFGFYKTKANPVPEKGVPKENVYSCVEVVDGERGGEDRNDWRVLRVDREIAAPQVMIRGAAQPRIAPGESVTVIGYPLGLPVKIAAGATVRSLAPSFFVANLDTYQGNSGSAVFNSDRLARGELLVEGLLVRGEDDFEIKSPCFLSKRCPIHGCRGEDVTFASKIERALAQ